MINDGFFTKKEVRSLSRPDGKSYSCFSCKLYQYCESPKLKPFGNFKKGILNIGSAPTAIDDRKGKPFQSKSGKLLQSTYQKYGIDLFEDCLNINAVQCTPFEDGKERLPTNYEIDCCRQIVMKIIHKYKPKVIVLFGDGALYSFMKHHWLKDLGKINKWRGFAIPDQDFKAWICPTYDMTYVHEAERNDINAIWEQDLKKILPLCETEFPVHKTPQIETIEDLSILEDIPEGLVAIDYETTGLKPHAFGHKIVCVSIATSADHAYSFMFPGSKKQRQYFKDFLSNKRIKKIAHNLKYEETWSVVRLKQPVRGWLWDTMLATHILDNRPGVTSLKFQTYVEFGIVDYSSEITPYLQSIESNNGNALNRIFDLIKLPGGKEKLMKYCGLDTIYTYRLAVKQMESVKFNF